MLGQKLKLIKLLSTKDLQNVHFKCSIEEIEFFFYKDSKKFIEDNYCQLYYLYEKKKATIIGYFTISMGSIRYEKDIPIEKYVERIPCALIGQLGVHESHQREGWGTDIVKDAISIIVKLSQRIGCRFISVDSLVTLNAIRFYLSLGFNFTDIKLGNLIINQLKDQKRPTKNSVKMYLDLKKIKK